MASIFAGSILRELYNGRIIPWERKEPRSAAYREAMSRIESEGEYFLQNLPPEDQERFQDLTKLYMDLSFIEEDNIFSYGWTSADPGRDERSRIDLRSIGGKAHRGRESRPLWAMDAVSRSVRGHGAARRGEGAPPYG